MKFLTGLFLIGVIITIYSYSYAQTGYTVNGQVLITNTLFAEGATIKLLKFPDSAVVKSTVCDKQGKFQFNNVQSGSYIVFINKLGYTKFYTGTLKVTSNTAISNITLIPASNDLKEVTITGQKNYIETRSDRTILNVDRSILAAGNSVLDILSTAPGVRVINNGVYLAGGKQALIAINGKPIGQLNDEQLADLLKSYQSSMISQIEIIPNPSAKYDAAGGGVINIILKKNKDYGFKANITESASGGQDYKFSNGINMNYRLKDVNFFGSYNFTDSKIPRVLDINRTIGPIALDENYSSTSFLKNNGFNAGVDYNVSPKQTIGALFYGYHNQLGIDKNNLTNILTNNTLDSDINTHSHINRSITNLNYNLNYKGSFGKNDGTTLSADFDYSTYRRYSSELLENSFFNPDGTTYRDPLFYIDDSPSQINVRSERIDFTQALSSTGILGVGLKNNQVNSNNMIEFDQSGNSTTGFLSVPSLTDHFIYNERINAAYLDYTDKFNKTSLSLDLRGEQTSSNAESLNPDKTILRSYFDFFPGVEITQPLNTDNTLILDYNRRITRPQYQDLNPFVAYIDQYSYSTGNTFLKPEYYNTYEISEIFKEKYKFDLSTVIINDFFTQVYQQNDATKVFTSTTGNIATRYEYNAELTIPFDVTNWWNVNAYGLASFQRYIYFADNAPKNTTDFEIDLTQNFTITNSIRAELYTSWESPTYFGIKQYAAAWQTRAGISKSILNKNGSIKLAISDIFNSEYYRYNSQYTNLNLNAYEKTGSRFVTATFTYRFGNQSVKTNARHTGGDLDEQKRLNGSTNEQ